MAFLRCLQTVSPAGGRRARARGGGVFQGGVHAIMTSIDASSRDTIELGVPRLTTPPSAYDPRAKARMCTS